MLQSKAVKERWRDILGFPGYQVSDLGRVRSFWIGRRGAVIQDRPHVLKPKWTGRGRSRPRVVLCNKGAHSQRYVYHLVLESFVGKCPVGMEARHLDDDQSNNRLTNLLWGTRSDNSKDRIRNGRTTARFSKGQRRVMYRMCVDGEPAVNIYKSAGVSYQCAQDFLRRFHGMVKR